MSLTKQHNPVWFPLGDQALMLDFTGFRPVTSPDSLAENADEIAQKIRSLSKRIASLNHAGIKDIVPALSRLMIRFDPATISTAQVKQILVPLIDAPFDKEEATGRHWLLPICYDGDCGPDIEEVAERCHISPEEVIERHLACTLEVSVMGFMPGNGYMTGVDPSLTLPRRSNPRVAVPERSVGIAIGQCVIYPLTSPGGWHLIGRVAFPLFDTSRDEPILLRTGDKVRFTRIDQEMLAHQEAGYRSGHFTVNDLIDKSGAL